MSVIYLKHQQFEPFVSSDLIKNLPGFHHFAHIQYFTGAFKPEVKILLMPLYMAIDATRTKIIL